MSEEEDRARYRYLQLKAKAAMSAEPQQQQPQPEQGIFGVVGAALGSRPELQPYSMTGGYQPPQTPIQGALSAAGQTLASPIRVGQTLAAGPQATGEAIAETGGELGYPKTGVALGAIPAMAPYVLGAYGALKGLSQSQAPLARAIRQTPREIGAEMQLGEQSVGVTSRLPELRGSKARFPQPEMNVATKAPRPIVPAETVPSVPPESYPRDPNTFINMAQDRITRFGDKLSPQELTDYQRQISNWFSTGKINPRDPIGAIATKVSKQAVELRNMMVPGRTELNQVYGLSKTLHPDVTGALKDYAAKYGKRALAEAVAIATGGAIASKFFK